MEDKLEKLKKKNDLSDIILEKDSSGGDKIKKLLLLAASLVLLFLIVLIGMKMFNSSNVSPSEKLSNIGDSIEEKGEDVLDSAKNTVDNAEDALFKKEAIIDENSETDLKFEEMVRKLKQQDAIENGVTPTKDLDSNINDMASQSKDSLASINDNVVDKIKDVATETRTSVSEVKNEVINVVKPTVAPVVEQYQEPKVIASTTRTQSTYTPSPNAVEQKNDTYVPTTAPRRVVNTTRSQPRTTTTSHAPLSSINGYFIQVGATSKSFPDRRFLQKIKDNGYDYIVHKISVKGRTIKKVLVGPYASRNQARNDLNGVQSSINPSAYIYRVK